MGYTATQNSDQTWNVLDVPVFGPLPAGARKNKEPIDAAWMRKAVAKSKLRAEENYFGPLHVRHTGDAAPKLPAGKFLLTRVGKFQYEGEKIAAIFADYRGMPDGEYQRLKRGELHFRSVEVFDWDVPEINEIALLETDTPYFRFGWDGIDREFPNVGDAKAFAPVRVEDSAAVAFAAVGAGGVALFAFEPKEKDSEDGDSKKSDDSDDEKKKDKGDEESECPGIDGKHCAGCPASKEDDDEDSKEKQRPPVDKKDDKKPEGAEMKANTDAIAALRLANETLQAEKGDLVARLSMLEAKDKERTAKSGADALVASARADLAEFNFSADVEAHVRFLAGSEKGEEKVKAFVAMFQAHALKDPPSSMDRAVGRKGVESLPAEFAAYPANQLDLVRECLSEFNAYSGKSFSGTALEYVKINLPGKIAALEGSAK